MAKLFAVRRRDVVPNPHLSDLTLVPEEVEVISRTNSGYRVHWKSGRDEKGHMMFDNKYDFFNTKIEALEHIGQWLEACDVLLNQKADEMRQAFEKLEAQKK